MGGRKKLPDKKKGEKRGGTQLKKVSGVSKGFLGRLHPKSKKGEGGKK